MGGNIFKNGSTKRQPVREFLDICAKFTGQLKGAFPHLHYEVLRAYANKPDFGNMSVFVLSDGPSTDGKVLTFLREITVDGKVALNGNRASIAHMGIQTDVTFVPANDYRFALSYHAFNGLGGMLGRVASSLGLTLRDNGMVYKLQDGDQAVAEINVADTWQQALMLLGYSFQRWSAGFESLEDIFDFVSSSEFFDPDLFLDVDPIVEDKRPTVVQLFAQYLQAASRPPSNVTTKKIELLFDRIPGFCKNYTDVSAQWSEHKAEQKVFSSKFNGHLVQEWTGRSGRALGDLMQQINQSFGEKEGLVMWVLDASSEQIKAMVMEQNQRLTQAA
jgi:hypothetical protein